MYRSQSGDNFNVEICDPVPLTTEEKIIFAPSLEKRGLTPDLLDIITNIPNRTRVVKVWSENKELVGLTTVLLAQAVFMKHCFGQGNHIGTNNTFFFSEKADKARVLNAIFNKFLELRPFGLYIGLIDDDLIKDFGPALQGIPHIVADKVMEAGSISTVNPDAEKSLLEKHDHLSRQVNRFRNKGGTIHIHEGVVNNDLTDSFVMCCKDSYQKNPHPGAPINVDAYSEHVRNFIQNYPSALYIYAKLNDQVVGVQIFIKHKHHLELTEGGFLSDTFHAYENIIVVSVRYAAEHGFNRVSYGLILNPAKDRLMDKETRKPIYMLMLHQGGVNPVGLQHMGGQAHEQFPQLYWRERSKFGELAI